MGERAIVEVADALNSGLRPRDITYVDGTVYRAASPEVRCRRRSLPSYGDLLADRRQYAASFRTQYRNTDPFSARALVEPYGPREYVIQNPPQKPLTQQEMDRVYSLPYVRTYTRRTRPPAACRPSRRCGSASSPAAGASAGAASAR